MSKNRVPKVHDLNKNVNGGKNKKVGKDRIISNIIIVITYLSFFALAFSVLTFDNLNMTMKFAGLLILFLVITFFVLLGLLFKNSKRKRGFRIFTSVILVLLLISINIGNYYYTRVFGALNQITNSKEFIRFELIVPNNSSVTTLQDLNGLRIGFQSTDSIEGNILAQKELKAKGINFTAENFNTYPEALDAMFQFGQVDAIIVPSLRDPRITNTEQYADIANMVNTIEQFSVQVTNTNTSNTNMVREPFTILINGIDTRTGNVEDNTMADVIMLVTVNPVTRHASMISIPRDAFMPIACNGFVGDKITHSGASGVQCTIDSVENYFGIDIDHYIKIDFDGVLKIVDALGGIEIDVPEQMDGVCEQDSSDIADQICFTSGWQTLDGQHALALARHRYTLERGDFDRNYHQQLVLSAMLSKLAHSGPEMINPVLNAMSGNIKTDLSNEQLIQLMQLGISSTNNASPYNPFGSFLVQRVEIECNTLELGDGIFYCQSSFASKNEVTTMINDIINSNARALPTYFTFSIFEEEEEEF